MREDFAVFILTHGRPNTQLTLNALRNSGYSGKIYLVIDDLDVTADVYLDNFRQNKYACTDVLVFNKMQYVQQTDTGLSEPLINFAVFARNAIEDFAVELGLSFFCMVDDDLTRFRFRYAQDDSLKSQQIYITMDEIITAHLDYMIEGNISCVSFGSPNNYMRGTQCFTELVDSDRTRLCCAIFFRNVRFKVNWFLNMCEDRITSFWYNREGQLWIQLLLVQLDWQELGGSSDGGNSEVYRSVDKFKQVCFPLLVFPDSNYVFSWKNKLMNGINSNTVCPKIISGGFKK